MAGRGPGPQEWKHNWIPLTPAAALVKAKGSKTTAAKLRKRHGVKASSTRDLVRAARQQSIDDRPSSSRNVGPSNDEKIRNAATMYGTGSPQHRAAQARFGEKPAARPKSQGDLLREADARRTKPLDLTTKRQTELAQKGGPGLARDVSRGSRVTLPDGRTVTAFDIAVDRDKGQVTIFPAQRDIDAGAPRRITVPDNARVTVEPKDDLAAARARRATEQSSRATQLRDRAAAERAKLQGIADRAGPPTTDPQANRLSARGLKQAHRNTDSSLRRYTETQQRANALESQAHLADARAKEAGRTRLTRADVEGATHIVDQHGQAREVVRVNAKTVTVKTPYSWTETVPIEKIRRAIKATPEQIAEARRRAAARKS